MPDIRQGEVVIEIDHPKNSDVYFFPTGTVVRSKIIQGRSGPGCPRPFVPILSIPGQRIHVDMKSGKARITDALGDKENSALLEKVKAAGANIQNARPMGITGPIPTVETTLDPASVNNWLFWMARFIDNGEAVQLSGEKIKPAREYRKAGNIKIPTTHPRWANAEFGSSTMKPLEAVAN